MGDVFSIGAFSKSHPLERCQSSKVFGADSRSELASCFLDFRRDRMDVLWLKENAEFLSVLRSCENHDTVLDSSFLGFLPFYEGCLRHFDFFKPYYRFILSICLDLEDLGLGDGRRGEALVNRILKSGVLDHELSDLQRAEVRCLMARRGCVPPALEGLDDRLREFMQHPAAFAVPNRRTAYELTHVVFYLSNYGRQDPKLSTKAVQSLEYIGVMAFLDQDADLLSEICLALHYAAQEVPAEWMAWLHAQRAACEMTSQSVGNIENDNYHTFLVMEWVISKVVNKPVFESSCAQPRRFICSGRKSVLRGITMALYSMDADGVRNRPATGQRLLSGLSPQDRDVFDRAAGSVACFDQFFEDFLARGYTRSGPCLVQAQ